MRDQVFTVAAINSNQPSLRRNDKLPCGTERPAHAPIIMKRNPNEKSPCLQPESCKPFCWP
jgi:hypothetical protein